MAFGPMDFVVLEFERGNFYAEVLADLTELVSGEIIRILDLVFIIKDEQGKVTVSELQEVEPYILKIFEPLRAEISGMVTDKDIKMIGEKLACNTTAAIMLLENLWVVKLKQDILQAGGRQVMHTRIPPEVIAEAIEDLVAIENYG
jgi:uncharacterized membrane protein